MALVIEDGTNVATANSFATLAQLRAYALARGVELSDDDSELEILAIKAMDYIKSRRTSYSGDRLYENQKLPFPRTGQYIDGVLVADGVIPPEVIELQAGVVMTLHAGINLFPTTAERAVKRSKTGPLETEWFDNDISPTVSMIDVLIAPLIGGSGSFGLTVRRI